MLFLEEGDWRTTKAIENRVRRRRQPQDEEKSQAQLVKELRQIRQRVEEFEQDQVRYKQLLDEYEESMTKYFDIYFHAHDMLVSVDVETEKVLQCSAIGL